LRGAKCGVENEKQQGIKEKDERRTESMVEAWRRWVERWR